jgi:hypothetical protein
VYAETGLEAIGNGLFQSLISIVEPVSALYLSNNCAYMGVKVNVLFHNRDSKVKASGFAGNAVQLRFEDRGDPSTRPAACSGRTDFG